MDRLLISNSDGPFFFDLLVGAWASSVCFITVLMLAFSTFDKFWLILCKIIKIFAHFIFLFNRIFSSGVIVLVDSNFDLVSIHASYDWKRLQSTHSSRESNKYRQELLSFRCMVLHGDFERIYAHSWLDRIRLSLSGLSVRMGCIFCEVQTAQMEYGSQLCCMQKFTSVFCRSFETDLSIAISFYLRKELVGKLTMYVFNRRNFELRTRYIDRTKRQNHSSYRSRPRGYRHVLFTIARSHKSVWNSHFHCNQLEE